MGKRLILSISYNPELLHIRQLLFEQHGYMVHSVAGFREASEAIDLHGSHVDLIILGHSIPHEEKAVLAARCKAQCPCPVLALLRWGEAPIPSADESILAPHPAKLIDAVAGLLRK